MRLFTIALLLCAFYFNTSASAQQITDVAPQAKVLLEKYSQKKSQHTAQATAYFSIEETTKQLVARRKATSKTARYAPEWCYKEGKISTLENGEQKYFIERYEYSEPFLFTITYHEVTEAGQFVAETWKGVGSVNTEDVMMLHLQTKVGDQWKDLYHFEGFYNEDLDQFMPTLTKEYNHYSNAYRTGTEVTTYKYYYQPDQPLEYEVIAEDDAKMGNVDYYDGVWIKGFRNGGYESLRSAMKGIWEHDEKLVVTQLNNQKESTHYIAFAQNQFIPVSQTITTYNAENLVEEEIKKDNEGEGFVNAERNLYTYQNGKLLAHEFFDADLEDPQHWILKRSTTNTYNAANQLAEKLEKLAVYVDEPLSFYKKTTYSYFPATHASADKVEQEQRFIANGSGGWFPEGRTIFSYSADGRYTSYTTETYNGIAWNLSQQIAYDVNDLGHLVGETNIQYSNGIAIRSNVKQNTYAQCSTVLSAPGDLANVAKTKIHAFPNPFSGQLTLRIELLKASEATVKIISQMGQTVKAFPTRKLSQGQHDLELDLGSLPVGVYFCQIQTAQGLETCRVVKQ